MLTSWLTAIRPINAAVVFAAVLVGGALCSDLDERVVVAGFVAVLVLSGGNLFNDARDIVSDSIAHPERPIAAGKIPVSAAVVVGVALMAVGFSVALVSLSEWAVFIVGVAVALLIVYSLVLSGIPLVGNLTIAFVSGLAVIFGAIAVGRVCGKAIWAAIIAAHIHLPREIFKDVQDVDGDRAAGRKTLPIVAGRRKASYMGVVACLLAMFAILLSYLVGVFSDYFFAASFVPFALIGMAAVFGGRGYPQTAQKYLKYAMVFGIFALGIEAFVPGG